jgi:hypothetical protein
VVVEFLVVDSQFVRNENVEVIESREEIVEKRRQVNVLILELEELVQHTQIVLSTIKVLMSTNGKFGKIVCQSEDSELMKLSDIWEKAACKSE